MESENEKNVKKITRTITGKSFRLIDFHFYDEKPKVETSSSDDDSVNNNNNNNNSIKSKYKKPEDAKFTIQMFGVNEKGETCCIYIDDYSPFFFVRIGDDWKKNDVAALLRELRNRVGKFMESAIVSAELVEYHKLYGFSGGRKHQFAKIVFKNTSTMNRVKNLWYKFIEKTAEGPVNRDAPYKVLQPFVFKGMPLELYESNIPPLLRYFHIHNISPSGWVFIPTQRVRTPEVKTTTCTYEYICTVNQVKSQPEKETRVPYKICSFDIEASSSHGDFPIPVKTYKRLASNMVDTFSRQLNSGTSAADTSRAALLLKRILCTAFGYDNFEDIDEVYPKIVPSKEKILKLITILQTTPVKTAGLLNEEEDNAHILAIDAIFEKIREVSEPAMESGTGGGDGCDDDSTEIAEVETAPAWTKFQSSKSKPQKIEKAATLIDVLLNNKYDRDAKISIANETLTLLFPRLKGDEVTFIGTTFLRSGETAPYLNHCLVVGDCDPVDGATIVSVKTEAEMLIEWANLIQDENPDIIIGYNIFGFDYEFMFRRAQETHCETEFLMLSRKNGELCVKRDNFGRDMNQDQDEANLDIDTHKITLATGEYELRYIKMTGRLQIDMYMYFRRNESLSSFKLDDVAGHFISDEVKHVLHKTHAQFGDISELYSQNLTGLNVGDYIHIEITGFTSDYYKDGKKFRILEIKRNQELMEIIKGKMQPNTYNVIVIAGHENIDQTKSIKWGMAKDDVSPQDIFRLAKGSSADRAIVAKYCIQDCNLVHHLMNKTDVITGYVEMARICTVPISFLVFRGQGIKLTSYVAKKCREKNTLMPDLEKTPYEKFDGALVLPPKCSMYIDNPVACVDYSSLYPSSMISQNYSHDSKVWIKEYDLSGKLIKETGVKDASGNYIYDNMAGYDYINTEFDAYNTFQKTPSSKVEKVLSGKKVCRWVQLPNNQKSIMPSILEELLKARSSTRQMIKTEKDPFMQNVLDKRQLGYKVTANSLYGQCGARTSTFYEQDVAASTTATGRQMLIYAKRIIEEVYRDRIYNTIVHGPVKCNAEYIYGDTDSVFFTFNLEHPETGAKIRGKSALEITIEIAQDAAKLCSKYLKPPMELSYEKTLMPFILLSKKRYVGILYETDANKGKMKYMGLSIKRRDSCDYLKDVYGGILKILMKNHNIKDAVDFLDKSIQDLIDGAVPMDKLMLTKALRGDYKNPHTIAHRVLADRIGRRDPGNKPKPGDRMKFAYIINPNKHALLGEKIETPEFINENKLSLDYTYYITNQLMKPLQQLLGLALEQIWEYQRKNAAIKTFRRDVARLEEETPDLELFMKKKEKMCSDKIKTLLFAKFLTQISHRQNNIQSITTFFGRIND